MLAGIFLTISGWVSQWILFRCLEHCTTEGTDYFGLIFGDQCSCGSSKPPTKYKKVESYCDKDCPGDPSSKCGGSGNRINLYEIGSAAATTTATSIATTITPSTVKATSELVQSNPLNWFKAGFTSNGGLLRKHCSTWSIFGGQICGTIKRLVLYNKYAITILTFHHCYGEWVE